MRAGSITTPHWRPKIRDFWPIFAQQFTWTTEFRGFSATNTGDAKHGTVFNKAWVSHGNSS
jgi:hypothetical protein